MNIRKIVKKLIPKGLFRRIEPLGHLLEAFFFNLINGFPGRGLKVIGITGTNGKTSTTWLVFRMLHEAGYKVGMMSTIAWGIGNDIHSQVHHYTNVPLPEFVKRLKAMRAAKVDYVVMEVTSHALAQNRVWGVPFSVAVMTNVTHEHLDYHQTFERYRDAKRKLFRLADTNRKGLRLGVVNVEDPSADLFAGDIANVILYGIGQGDLQAVNVNLQPAGSVYTARIGKDEYHIRCRLPGSFNVSNSLAAVAVGHGLGLDPKQIEEGIEALEGVEGRMTHLDEGQNFDVIVDYAHTPDSFEKLFKDIKPLVKGRGRLLVMFGSAGERDEAKRAVQGELAGKYCDEVILTEEDDRNEDGHKILDQIAKGAEKAGKARDKDLFLVHDRTKAIKFTLKRAKPGDTVLLLGKGHEKTIERDDREDPWDETGTVRTVLKA